MSFILDNLTATIIGTVALLIILTMQHQVRESSTERTAVYMAKNQSLELGNWMQRDLSNFGAGINPGQPVFDGTEKNAAGLTKTFSFRRRADSTAASPVIQISYELAQKDSVKLNGNYVKLYQVIRKVDGVKTGSSPALLTDFVIELLDATGATTYAASAAAYLRVRFAMALPFARDRFFIRQTHWATTLPLNTV